VRHASDNDTAIVSVAVRARARSTFAAPCHDARGVFEVPPLSIVVPLALAALVGFSVETMLGFGATLVTVAIGSFFVDLRVLLPAIAPLNLTLSLYIVARYHRDVDRRVLFGKLVPFMTIGLPIGVLLLAVADASVLKRVFGAFLVVVSVIELWRARSEDTREALPRSQEIALLVTGGAVHGAFMTGGPMAVYVASRLLHDKARYRATLSSLWAILNVMILASYAVEGRFGADERGLSVALVPAIVGGMVVGELAFHRVPAALFRTAVFVMLLASGAALMVRG
jgi:uncharacterized membrane protein YfcA